MRNFNFLKIALIISGLFFSSAIFGQKSQITPSFKSPFQTKGFLNKQQAVRPSTDKTIKKNTNDWSLEKNENTYNIKFLNNSKSKQIDFFSAFLKELNLKENDKFLLKNSHNDELNFTHYNYYQYYNGIAVEGGQFLLHEKDGVLKTANGKFYDELQINTTPDITKKVAYEKAIVLFNISENPILESHYSNAELVITPINGIYKLENFRLCWKFTITTKNPYGIWTTYIDAHTGTLVNKISQITDATGTASTMYSDTQSIETEYFNGSYRLRDATRNIETYDATNDTNFVENVGFTSPKDFYDSDNNWQGENYLTQVTINTISQSWWYAAYVDVEPDLYVLIKDASNDVVYFDRYYYKNNMQPPNTFYAYLQLINPPYSIEIYDYDLVGSDDFGGSYSINISTGTQSFSGNGNAGNYTIEQRNNPALDVHWGMEKTYDYYLSKHSRNSYDGNGSVIKNFYNPIFFDCDTCNPNNAAALPPPYNFMVYGKGDGDKANPVVGLDVEGHEFSHMVTNYSIFDQNNNPVGLKYQNESGALNESFSDIFGTAIEFYAKPSSANWTIAEGIMIKSPYYARSMSNPSTTALAENDRQPNTYGAGSYWGQPVSIPNESNDKGWVHKNSGVQNCWFYLLCQGGSGTNDIGNTYNVAGIGITKAEKIAYRNLTTYLTTNATYYDAMQGSLQATEDLHGAGSTEYWAVKDAWYAVGLGNTSNNVYCSGVTTLTNSTGTISDGSGNTNYLDNSDCMWLIQPAGANTITLNFTAFDTENGYDSLMVYDGPDTNSTLLMTWWGNTMPPQITSTGGAMFIRFMADYMINATGWNANYTSTGSPTCDGGSIQTSQTGSFSDGSGSGNYGNNQTCSWLIAPPCATSISLSFSAFNTEQDYDGIIVFDGNNTDSPQLGVFTGTSNPGTITSSGGEMLVLFISDYIVTKSGFTANYTSTGTPYCSGTTTLTDDFAFFDDGSSTNNYCNNANCSWLIQPTDAISITLFFDAFDLEQPSSDGAVYDAIRVYDGANSSATLLGTFSGSNIPQTINSSGGSLFVQFTTDFSENFSGFSAYYLTNTSTFCNNNNVLTTQSGTITDGSNSNKYGNNTECSWLIQPTNAESITLSFTAFDTEQDYDGVIVYDGIDSSANVLGTFTGTTIPNPITTTDGSMYILFASDQSVRANGWAANYTSTLSNPLSITVSSTPSSICNGNSVQLNSSVTGGTGSYSYNWSSNPIGFTSAISNPQVYPTITTTYSVTVTSGTQNITSSVIVNVNSLPTTPSITQSGATTFCAGGSVNLYAPNGFTYLWSNGATTQSISATTANSYTVQVTDGNGCTSASSAPVSVTVNSLPTTPTITYSGSTSICQGNSITLNAPAGYYYLWSNGATSQTINVSINGTYSVQVTDGNNCQSLASTGVTITVNSIPATPVITQNQNTLTSNSATGNQWYNSAGIINGATSQNYTATVDDTYYVIVSENGCNSAQSNSIVVIGTNIEQSSYNSGFVIFPNPIKNELHIKTNNSISTQTFEIINNLGQVVYNSTVNQATVVDMSKFPSGVYSVKMFVGDEAVYKRFVKE